MIIHYLYKYLTWLYCILKKKNYYWIKWVSCENSEGFVCLFVSAVLGLERIPYLLGMCSTTWTTAPGLRNLIVLFKKYCADYQLIAKTKTWQ
jgi:hypothetical protein